MKNIDWDKFQDKKQIIEYLKKLPRYRNSSLKSAYRRGIFFLNLVYCRIFGIKKPLFVVLVTNNNCNLNCSYCYGNYGTRKARDNYSTKQLLQMIDELKKIGTKLLTIHGGESLLLKDIGEILNYAKQKGFYISFNTNGHLIPRKIKELQCIDTMVISLDGQKQSNDKNRGEGNYQKVMEAIDVVLQHEIPLVISATLTGYNTDDMVFLAKLGKNKGLRIQYSILYNQEKLTETDYMGVPADQQIRDTTRKIFELKKAGYPIYYSDNVLKTTINWPVSFAKKRYFTLDDADFTNKQYLIPCYHGNLKYQIDADGRVVRCWAHDKPDAPNIKTLGIEQAFKQVQADNYCQHCAYLANNEHNAVMHLSPKNILNILYIHIMDSFKLKK
jgi:MoaA/NifB/PqqE/SkfB family radical SAM enzyme